MWSLKKKEKDEKKLSYNKQKKKKNTIFEFYMCYPKEHRKMKEAIIKENFPELTQRAKFIYWQFSLGLCKTTENY